MVPLPGQTEKEQAQAYLIEKFGSLNTKATRPGIGDEEFSWIENFMPIGDSNMRTLYAEDEDIYTAPDGLTIIFSYPFNIGLDSFIAVFLDDGTAVQVDVSDGSTIDISSTPGTFWTSGDLPACSQWQSKFLLIASTVSDNAYWIWDGASLYGSGTLSPDVTLTSSGRGYTSAPTVTAYGGTGTGATFTATVDNGAVTDVKVTDPGSGYLFQENVVLAFSGGGSDNGAAATATINAAVGGVSSVVVTSPGSGYTTASVITFTGGGGTGAQAVISGAVDGQITQITVINPGTGYTSAPTVAATVGTGLAANATIIKGQVSAITVATGGTGYDTPPLVTVTGDGVGALATATVVAGVVTAVVVTEAGIGYTEASVSFAGGNDAATATVTLMPFGVKGTTIETYQSHVWIANGTTVQFTAPGSTSVFATSQGGGAYAATESFLRSRITRLIQSNGFLYQYGDSSINVVSNVQTVGTPPTTSFSNSNVDPQTGTAWRDSVAAFGRALVFANPTGVYALYGGAAEKVSGPLDGLFSAASFNTGQDGVTPTASVAILFGIRVYMLLFTTTDPYTNTLRDIMCIWDGQKWFVGSQIKPPIALSTQEINSDLATYGCDGTTLYKLYQTPSDTLQKVWQTKLRADPGYIIIKQVNRLYLLSQSNTDQPADVFVYIDTERGLGGAGQATEFNAGQLIFVGNDGIPITWIGAGGDELTWATGGLTLTGYTVSDFGKLIGFTGTTLSPDVTIISLMALWREYAPYA